MKVFAILASLALAAHATHAAECTADTLSAVQGKSEFTAVQSACGSAISTAVSATDMEAAAKKLCQEKTCLNALEAAIKTFPDCTIQGVAFKKTYENQFQTIQSECKKLTSSAPAMATGLSATAVAAAATVAVFAQL